MFIITIYFRQAPENEFSYDYAITLLSPLHTKLQVLVKFIIPLLFFTITISNKR